MASGTGGGPWRRGGSRLPHALEFGLALSALSFVVLVSFANVLAALLAVFGNLFYVPRLHAVAEALDAAETSSSAEPERLFHARGRVGSCDGNLNSAGAPALPDRLLLDTAALLALAFAHTARVRGSPRPDAPGGPKESRRRRARSSATPSS